VTIKATEKLTVTHHFPKPGQEAKFKHIDLVSWIGVDKVKELVKDAYVKEGLDAPW